MRTASGQFAWWTRAEAERVVSAMPTSDNYGDRVAASRRVSLPPSPLPLAEFTRRFRQFDAAPQPYRRTKRA